MIIWRRYLLTLLLAAVTVAAVFVITALNWPSLQDSTGDEGLTYSVKVESLPPTTIALNKPMKGSPTLHKEVRLTGTNLHRQALKGSVLDKSGVKVNLTSDISTELVYSFSPSTEQLFSKKIVDPMHQQKVLANSPAMIWYEDRFVVVMRMWLDKEETEGKTENVFSDNYFYRRTFSDQMEPLDGSGHMMGMPTRVREGVGDGPIEPRAFPFYNKLYLSFNSAVSVNGKLVDTTMLWDYDEDRFVMPEIRDGQPQLSKKLMPRDKHWSPYTYQDELYMVYSLDPLRIIKCDRDARCSFTQNAAPNGYKFNDLHDCLRGGTPTLHYWDDYYISVAHSTLFRISPKWKRYYTLNLVVMKVSSPVHQIVYLSEPINIDPELLSRIPIVRKEWIDDPFLFPVSLLLESEDSAIIGGHINDHSSYLVRLRGLKQLMDQVIGSSEPLGSEGPDPGLLHQLSRQFAVAQTGLEFTEN